MIDFLDISRTAFCSLCVCERDKPRKSNQAINRIIVINKKLNKLTVYFEQLRKLN